MSKGMRPDTKVDLSLFNEIRDLIVQARSRVASTVNAELTLLYWEIGTRIHKQILKGSRGDYSDTLIENLAIQLTEALGKGWKKRQLHYCVQFATEYPDIEIVHALRAQLSWTHIRLILAIDDPLKRDFYSEMTQQEGWSTRQLNERIKSMLFERTAISQKPHETIANDLSQLRDHGIVSTDLAFRDPYLLDFLGLSDTYSEQDLESAILVELQRFIIELGSDFAFMARQKRITIDDRDYYIDLLFYHRRLRRLVAIDLLCARAHNKSSVAAA